MRDFDEYLAPDSVEDALAFLTEKGAAACILAGGTDLMVRMKAGVLPEEKRALLSLHKLSRMRTISEAGKELRIGAAVTAAELTRSRRVAQHVPILAEVADKVASMQIRNVATIGGNLANASPAGDLINPLLLLEAHLVLVSSEGTRVVAVEDFFTGPGQSVLRPDELLLEVRVTVPTARRVFRFKKAGTRPSMECSVITVGVAYTPREGTLNDVRIAYGSAAPVPMRGRKAEAVLEGKEPTPERIEEAALAAAAEVSPIRDVRGGVRYRRALVAEFVRRLLHGEG